MVRHARAWAAAAASACALGAVVTVLAQAPDSAGPDLRTAPITETSTPPYQAPPPPIMLPGNIPVPCMGFAPGGCDNTQQ